MKTHYLITIAAVILGLTGAGCEYYYPAEGRIAEGTKIQEGVTETTETIETIIPSESASDETIQNLEQRIRELKEQLANPPAVSPTPPSEVPPASEGPSSEIPAAETPEEDPGMPPDSVSTDTTPPTVVLTSPRAVDGADLVSTIVVTFSEAMDLATITPSKMVVTTVIAGAAPAVTIVGVSQINSKTFGFILNGPLAAGIWYDAVVAGSVTDLAGNQLTGNYSWSFRTAGGQPPAGNTRQINAGMLLWNGATLNWEGIQAFELDALGVGLTSADTSTSGEINGSIVNRFKRNGPIAKPYDYRSYLTAVAFDSSTLKRVTRSYSRDHGCVVSPNTDPPPMAINVSQEFGAAWAGDTSGRYLYYAVLRSFEFDLADSVGPEDVQVDVTLANDNHLPNAQGRLLPQITVDVNGPVDAFNCPFTVAFDVIGIDTTVWAARWFDTDGQSPELGGGTYYFLKDVSFPFEIPGVDQVFVGLKGWGHNLEIEGNFFEIDSLGSWVSLVEVAENVARLKIAGHVQGYLSISPDADEADAHASDRTRGYLFACKSEDICKVGNRNLGGSYEDDIRYTRPLTVSVE